MKYNPLSISTFLGAKDFEKSRRFYSELSYKEIKINPKMSYFRIKDSLGFYLQDYYVKDWVANSMMFLEVDDIDFCHNELLIKDLPSRYEHVKITEIKTEPWAKVFNLFDPSGILWQIASFANKPPTS